MYNSTSLRRLVDERPGAKGGACLDLDPPILNALGAYKSRAASPWGSIPVEVAREIVDGALTAEANR